MSKATEGYRDGVVREGDAPWMPYRNNAERGSAVGDDAMILGDPVEAAQRLLDLGGTLGTTRFILKLPFILEVPERAVVLDQLAAISEVIQRVRSAGA
jgi:hypothetical protein